MQHISCSPVLVSLVLQMTMMISWAGAENAPAAGGDAVPAIEVSTQELELVPGGETGSARGTHSLTVTPRGPRMEVQLAALGGAGDLKLRVLDGAGELLAEDDDSGGGTIPWVEIDLTEATSLRIEVLAEGLAEPTTCRLHIVQIHETAATLEALAGLEERAAAVAEALDSGEPARAGELARPLIGELLALPGIEHSDAATDLLWEVASGAEKARLHQLEQKALRPIVALREQVMLPEHPDLQAAQARLAHTVLNLGNPREARKVYERILEVRKATYPAEHGRVLDARMNVAMALQLEGDLGRARAIGEDVVEIRERTLSADDPDLQKARQNLAATLQQLGDNDATREQIEKVLASRERTLPEGDRLLQSTRMMCGAMRYFTGDLAGAVELYGKIAAALEGKAAADDADLLAAWQNQAVVLGELGKLEEASVIEGKLVAALAGTRPDADPALLAARGRHAVTLRQLGDLRGASEMQASVLAVYEKMLPEAHPELLRLQEEYASTLFVLGDLEGARRIQQKVLAIEERVLPPGDISLQVTRSNYASTLRQLGDVVGANELEEAALQVLERTVPADDRLLQSVRGGHAQTLRALGDHQGARQLFERVIAVWEKQYPEEYPDLLMMRQELALTLRELGEYEGTREILEDILAVRERTLPEDHPDLLGARSNYATILTSLGDYPGAIEIYRNSIELLEKTLPPTHPGLLVTRLNQAELLARIGQHEAALTIGEGVLAIEEGARPADDPDLQAARYNVATLLLRGGGDVARHAELLREICAGVLLQQANFRPQLAHRQAASLAGRAHRDISLVLSHSAVLTGEARGALEPTLLSTIETVRCAESAMRRLTRLAPRPGSAEAGRAEALRAEINRASQAIALHAEEAGGLEALRESIREKERAERALVELLAKQPGARPLLEATTASALARALRPREAAVAIWTYYDFEIEDSPEGRRTGDPVRSYVALVVRDDGAVSRVELGPAPRIERRVEVWRTLVRSGKGMDDPVLRAQAVALRAAILDPILAAAGDVDLLVVALDEALHLVPLDSLPGDPEGETLVGDAVQIRNVTALRDLLLVGEEPALAEASLVAAGAIDYGADLGDGADVGPALAQLAEGAGTPGLGDVLRGQSFEPIPATGEEVAAVAALYGGAFESGAPAEVLTGARATRTEFLKAIEGKRYLHLATHAWFAPEEVASTGDRAAAGTGPTLPSEAVGQTVHGFAPMLLCGVALAGAGAEQDRAEDTGILTAQEIASLDLSGCELAVLSACETSLGSRRPGQGVASLQQALHAAGVRLSLTSLWKVPDSATQRLMAEFYHRLWDEGQPAHRALWEAKRTLREAKGADGKSLYAPRDWAGWVLSGVIADESR